MDAPAGPPPGVKGGVVSEPEYGCGDVQPFFEVWSTAYAYVAPVKTAARTARTPSSHLAREPIHLYSGTDLRLCQPQ